MASKYMCVRVILVFICLSGFVFLIQELSAVIHEKYYFQCQMIQKCLCLEIVVSHAARARKTGVSSTYVVWETETIIN